MMRHRHVVQYINVLTYQVMLGPRHSCICPMTDRPIVVSNMVCSRDHAYQYYQQREGNLISLFQTLPFGRMCPRYAAALHLSISSRFILDLHGGRCVKASSTEKERSGVLGHPLLSKYF
jgi:hypothetical protein